VVSNTRWTALTIGGSDTLALGDDGSLWAWGGSYGNAPVRIGADDDWACVSAGGSHFLAVKQDGTLWAWGSNYYGQLGDGTKADRAAPGPVGSDADWLTVAAGGRHNLGIRRDGTLWAWGQGTSGELGIGTLADQPTPVQVGSDNDWAQVAAGLWYSLAIKADGSLWAWGENWNGVLGLGTIPYGYSRHPSPRRVGSDRWHQVAAGREERTVGIKEDGSLWHWGRITFDTAQHSGAPVRLGNDDGWVGVGAEMTRAAAIRKDGTVWVWGNAGTLLMAGPSSLTEPVQIGTDTDWIDVQGGNASGFALKEDGVAYAWGLNPYAQLGMGWELDLVPEPAPIPASVRWTALSVGRGTSSLSSVGAHTLGLAVDGSLWGWGRNIAAQVGVGTTRYGEVERPALVDPDPGWISFSANAEYSLAVRDDGSLWAWGQNHCGELGDGTRRHNWYADKLVPTPIGADTDWKQVAASKTYTSMGLKTDGTLWIWGGDCSGDYPERWAPLQVGHASDWARIEEWFALKQDGTLWVVPRAADPIAVSPGSTWVSFSPGRYVYESYGVRADGTLWSLEYGPVWVDGVQVFLSKRVGADSDWARVSTGRSTTFLLREDGTIWALGGKRYSGLGPRYTGLSEEPLDIPGLALDVTPPVVVASPPPGRYEEPVVVTLNVWDETDRFPVVRHTLDGSEPRDDSPLLHGPLQLSETTTVRWVAVDAAGNRSAVSTVVYEVGPACAGPADVNCDEVVDAGDYRMFQQTFGSCAGQSRYLETCDLDRDGCVTLVDYQLWYASYLRR
jgi:alpha-tubulin suppressor-like RCC1 family protein